MSRLSKRQVGNVGNKKQAQSDAELSSLEAVMRENQGDCSGELPSLGEGEVRGKGRTYNAGLCEGNSCESK